jgi:hypothetical protein
MLRQVQHVREFIIVYPNLAHPEPVEGELQLGFRTNTNQELKRTL